MIDIEQFARSGRLFDDRYELLEPLSKAGGSGDVWLAIDRNTAPDDAPDAPDGGGDCSRGVKMVVKIYRPGNFLDMEGERRFREEFAIVYNCHHSNLITPTNFAVFNGLPYLVMPYCPAGSSEQLVGELTDESRFWKYVADVASGLAYLHAQQPPIVHQDIKPDNVLLDGNGNYAITDFGISATTGNHPSDNNSCGTNGYMAPERYRPGDRPAPASDIWSLGATLYELVAGELPFGKYGGRNQSATSTLAFPADVPSGVQRLIAACLDYSPDNRPTAQQIVEQCASRGRHRWQWGVAVLAVALAAVVGTHLAGQWSKQRAEQEIEARFAGECSRAEALTRPASDMAERLGVAAVDSLDDDVLARLKEAAEHYQAAAEQAPAHPHVARARRKAQVIGDIIANRQKYLDYTDSARHYREMSATFATQDMQDSASATANEIHKQLIDL